MKGDVVSTLNLLTLQSVGREEQISLNDSSNAKLGELDQSDLHLVIEISGLDVIVDVLWSLIHLWNFIEDRLLGHEELTIGWIGTTENCRRAIPLDRDGSRGSFSGQRVTNRTKSLNGRLGALDTTIEDLILHMS